MTFYEKLPNDPIMLLSFINTRLRDSYESLEDFCAATGADIEEIAAKLGTVDYEYDADRNQFV